MARALARALCEREGPEEELGGCGWEEDEEEDEEEEEEEEGLKEVDWVRKAARRFARKGLFVDMIFI